MTALCKLCERFQLKSLGSPLPESLMQSVSQHFKHIEDFDDGVIDYMLHHTVAKNHIKCLKAVLESGENIDQPSKHSGRTPVILAAKHGHTEILELLIKQGADVNIRDKLGKNGLWYAASFGYLSCVHALLNAATQHEYKDVHTKQSPLVAATWACNLDCMEALIHHGAKFGLFESENNSWYVFGPVISRLKSIKLKKILEMMIAVEGALTFDIFLDIVNKKYENDGELLEWLLLNDIEIRHSLGVTVDYNEALFLAIENSNELSVRILLENKQKLALDVNKCVRVWKTALQMACDQPSAAIFNMLLENGSEPDLTAHKQTRPPVFMVLRTLSYQPSALKKLVALIKYDCDMEQKFPVNVRDVGNVSFTPLEFALHGNNLYAAQVLIMAGAQSYNPSYSLLQPHKKIVHTNMECTFSEKESFIREHLPRTLYHLCRASILHLMRGWVSAQDKVNQLPIPSHIQQFLTFCDMDGIAEEFENKMKTLQIPREDEQEESCESMSESDTDSSLSSPSEESEDDSDSDDDDDDDDDDDFSFPFVDSSKGLLYGARYVLDKLDRKDN